MSKYSVLGVDKFEIEPNCQFACEFKGRRLMGCGSSLAIESEDDDGIQISMLTDRGPNMNGPKVDGKFGKIFLIPEFTPQIIRGRLKGDILDITDRVKLVSESGIAMTGRPSNKNIMNEIPLNSELEIIGFDPFGIDPEGLSIGKDKSIWVCEEYGPSLIKFDSTGKEIMRLSPGCGLPQIYEKIYPNRGFEAISVAPGGMIFAALQSILDSGEENFVRFLKFDENSKEVTEYAYEFDNDKYINDRDAKIGDIFAISDNELIVIEQGKCKKEENETGKRAVIYKVYLDGENEKMNHVEKELVIDLSNIGWDYYKTEGVAITADGKSILIVNDNDFSIDARTYDENDNEINIIEFEYDGKCYWNENGERFIFKTRFIDTHEKLELWRIVLDKSLRNER